MTPDTWKELFNYGVPTALICFVGIAVWRIVKFLGRALFDDAHGVVVRYVSKHEEFLNGLSRRDEKQQAFCASHASLMAQMTELLTDRTPIIIETRDGIKRLVELSERRDSPISTQALQAALPAFKLAAIEHCEMCRKIVQHQMPQIATEVCGHIDAMEKIVEGIEE